MQPANFSYFDHDADIGIVGSGPTLEAAFVSAAAAMFAIMADLHSVAGKQCVAIEFEETDVELALVTWLNLLLAEARENGMVFSRFELSRNHHHWQGRACGEHWHAALERGTEVKGATLTMLSVKPTDHGWEARCIVDV